MRHVQPGHDAGRELVQRAFHRPEVFRAAVRVELVDLLRQPTGDVANTVAETAQAAVALLRIVDHLHADVGLEVGARRLLVGREQLLDLLVERVEHRVDVVARLLVDIENGAVHRVALSRVAVPRLLLDVEDAREHAGPPRVHACERRGRGSVGLAACGREDGLLVVAVGSRRTCGVRTCRVARVEDGGERRLVRSRELLLREPVGLHLRVDFACRSREVRRRLRLRGWHRIGGRHRRERGMARVVDELVRLLRVLLRAISGASVVLLMSLSAASRPVVTSPWIVSLRGLDLLPSRRLRPLPPLREEPCPLIAFCRASLKAAGSNRPGCASPIASTCSSAAWRSTSATAFGADAACAFAAASVCGTVVLRATGGRVGPRANASSGDSSSAAAGGPTAAGVGAAGAGAAATGVAGTPGCAAAGATGVAPAGLGVSATGATGATASPETAGATGSGRTTTTSAGSGSGTGGARAAAVVESGVAAGGPRAGVAGASGAAAWGSGRGRSGTTTAGGRSKGAAGGAAAFRCCRRSSTSAAGTTTAAASVSRARFAMRSRVVSIGAGSPAAVSGAGGPASATCSRSRVAATAATGCSLTGTSTTGSDRLREAGSGAAGRGSAGAAARAPFILVILRLQRVE